MRIALLIPVAALLLTVLPTPARVTAAAPDPRTTGRHFLAFDPAGDGTAVEVLGDLDTAARVVILVPGMNTRLRDFDRGLGGVARRAPAVQARALYAELGDDHTAVVAWLGYDPPDGFGPAAIGEGRAQAGAVALRAFVRDVTARRPGAEVTLIGHSYGAIVVGLAARGLPGVTAVVALGAPGMGVDRAADLGGVPVWSALAATDWIRRVPPVRLFGLGHGRPPSSPAFGARPLDAAGVDGHDGYLVPGSSTLAAVAAVVTGTRDRNRPPSDPSRPLPDPSRALPDPSRALPDPSRPLPDLSRALPDPSRASSGRSRA